jgi:hypothetical protein
VYSLTKPGEVGNNQHIAEAVYGMFDRAAQIAFTLGVGHDRVIYLALWSDGELGYHAWDAVAWLLENDPTLTAAAIKRLPREDQKRMCRGRSVDKLPTRRIVVQCMPDV